MSNKNKLNIKSTSSNAMPLYQLMLLHSLLIVGVIVSILPFFHLFMTAFKTYPETIKAPLVWIPQTPNLEAFKTVFEKLPFATMLGNSLITTLFITVGQVLFSAMAGFALATLNIPRKNIILLICLAILMVPSQIYLIPQFLLIQRLHLGNTLTAIVLPNLFSALGIFLFRQAFLSLPRSLYEAAVLDGCNPVMVFWYVMLPLVKPTVTTFGVLASLYSWNSLMWPLIVNSSQSKYTLAVGLATLLGDSRTEYPVLMAGATVAIVPMIIVFLIFRKQILENNSYLGTK